MKRKKKDVKSWMPLKSKDYNVYDDNIAINVIMSNPKSMEICYEQVKYNYSVKLGSYGFVLYTYYNRIEKHLEKVYNISMACLYNLRMKHKLKYQNHTLKDASSYIIYDIMHKNNNTVSYLNDDNEVSSDNGVTYFNIFNKRREVVKSDMNNATKYSIRIINKFGDGILNERNYRV